MSYDKENSDIYFIEGHQLKSLDSICNDLFGDGSSLDPDKRRDMANLMHLILQEIGEQKDGNN